MGAGRTFEWSKTFRAGANVRPRRIMQGSNNGETASEATAPTQLLFGVSYIPDSYRDPIIYGQTPPAIQVLQNEPVDVQFAGIAEVILGANLNAFTWVTTDNQGRAVAAANGNFVVGYLSKGGSTGEIGQVVIAPGRFYVPA